jgi:hypothetical protein
VSFASLQSRDRSLGFDFTNTDAEVVRKIKICTEPVLEPNYVSHVLNKIFSLGILPLPFLFATRS